MNSYLTKTLCQTNWRCRGSNPVPPACKAGALPFELHPRVDKSGTLNIMFIKTVIHEEINVCFKESWQWRLVQTNWHKRVDASICVSMQPCTNENRRYVIREVHLICKLSPRATAIQGSASVYIIGFCNNIDLNQRNIMEETFLYTRQIK